MMQNFKPEIKLFVIVAIVAVVIAVGSIFLLRAGVSNQVTHTPSPQPQAINNQQSAIDTSDPALSEVEGWQTYRNDEFGFEIEYPGNARISESSEAWPFVSIEIDAGSIIVAPQERYPRGYTNPEIHFQSEDVFFAGRMARKTSVLFEDEVASFFL